MFANLALKFAKIKVQSASNNLFFYLNMNPFDQTLNMDSPTGS